MVSVAGNIEDPLDTFVDLVAANPEPDASGQLLLFPETFRRHDERPEEWLPVRDFPGYFVSSHGRFRHQSGRFLKGTKVGNGYIHIGFMRHGKQVWGLAHRVVADAFIPKPEAKGFLVVNHIDRNRVNNAAANLEWVTVSANAIHWRRPR